MTFYWFSRYIQAWLLPPGSNFLAIALGFLLSFYFRKIGRFLIAFGFITLWLLSMPIVAYPLINHLQDRYPILQVKTYNREPNTVIVVLGGGNTVRAEYGYQEMVSDVTLHRVHYGAYLQQQTHLPIIVSGGKTNEVEASLMAKELNDRFQIKPDGLEDKSLTTAEQSLFIKTMLKEKHWNQIILVTSAWHMPRSVYAFERAGISVIPAPMGHYVYGPGYSLISYFPNMNALSASSVAIYEYIGLLLYHIRYGKHGMQLAS